MAASDTGWRGAEAAPVPGNIRQRRGAPRRGWTTAGYSPGAGSARLVTQCRAELHSRGCSLRHERRVGKPAADGKPYRGAIRRAPVVAIVERLERAGADGRAWRPAESALWRHAARRMPGTSRRLSTGRLPTTPGHSATFHPSRGDDLVRGVAFPWQRGPAPGCFPSTRSPAGSMADLRSRRDVRAVRGLHEPPRDAHMWVG